MDKYKVAIVDDDEVALENLSFELGKDARFFLKGTARNGKQGKKLIAKVQPDLLFLDVGLYASRTASCCGALANGFPAASSCSLP